MGDEKQKRRDKGEGSIFQRKDGTWVARYKAPNMTKPKERKAKSETEAKRKLKALKMEAIDNTPDGIKKLSVKDYMEKWLITVKVNDLKPKSYDRLELTLNAHVFPYIGDYQVSSINADNVQDMINALKEKKPENRKSSDEGLSYSTIKKAYDAVNACFKLGIIKGDFVRNPCAGVSLPENKKKKISDIRWFKDDEIEKICKMSLVRYGNNKQVYRLGHVIILLMYSGMRIAELLGLKWKDVDIPNKGITIRTSAVVVKNRDKKTKTKNKLLVQDDTKTESSERIIPLNKKAINALEEIKNITGNNDYVMCSSKGKILNPKNVDRMFRNILERCEIEPCGVHTCRHTFASLLFKKGVDVKTVSEILGHKDVTITYNIYIHIIREQKHQAVDLLDDL